MVNTQRPDDSFVNPDPDDVEGHLDIRNVGGKAVEEDTEGHGRVLRADGADEGDVEGHGRVLRADGTDDDDVEGHGGRVLR